MCWPPDSEGCIQSTLLPAHPALPGWVQSRALLWPERPLPGKPPGACHLPASPPRTGRWSSGSRVHPFFMHFLLARWAWCTAPGGTVAVRANDWGQSHPQYPRPWLLVPCLARWARCRGIGWAAARRPPLRVPGRVPGARAGASGRRGRRLFARPSARAAGGRPRAAPARARRAPRAPRRHTLGGRGGEESGGGAGRAAGMRNRRAG